MKAIILCGEGEEGFAPLTLERPLPLLSLFDKPLLAYLAYDADKVEKLLDNPRLLKTPIVRNGRQATVGYCPEVWQGWA